MRVHRPLLLILACLVIPAALQAQQSGSTPPASPPTSDPQAVALVQRALAVLTGGVAVTDVTLTGSAHRIAGSDDETGTATLEASAAGDSRFDLSFASGNRIEVRNHSALPPPGSLPPGVPASVAQTPQPVGEWLGPDGAPHPMADYNIMTDAAWFFPALTLARLATAPNIVLSYVGQETLAEAGPDGQTVLHISASQQFPQPSANANAAPGPAVATILQHLTQMDIYLDPASLVPVAFAFNTHPEPKGLVGIPVQIRPDANALVDIPVQIQFSNYQSTNGMQVPFHVEKYLNCSLVFDLQFTNVTFNSGLSASAFALQ